MSGFRRHRLLSDEEIELWRAVAETVAPRPGSRLPSVALAPRPGLREPVVAPQPGPKRLTMPSYSPPLDQPRPKLPPLASLERRYKKKVVKGAVAIERVMDLHGLNQAAAHGALRVFLQAAQADGVALVLVVTGKGRGATRTDPAEVGVLRRAVPHWLREPDLRNVVLGFEEAGQGHGGAGALYIRLRRHSR